MLKLSDQAEGLRTSRRALSNSSPSVRPPRAVRFGARRTVAITSGKGGVGKTQLSANLAVALARDGERVLLVDADLGLASLDLALGLSPQVDLLSVLRGEATAKDVILEGAAGVQLLPACPGRYEMANLEPAQQDRLIELLAQATRDYDTCVVDTGAGIGSTSINFAAAADEVVLVATPEPTSLRDAYATAKVLHRRHGIERILLVANQVEEESQGLEVFERLNAIIERFLSLELKYLGSVPRDPAVLRGVTRGEPCVVGAPTGPAARAFSVIARRFRAHKPANPVLPC